MVALVGTSSASATVGPALGAAPEVLRLATGCALLVTVPGGVAEAGIAVAALPGGQSIAVAFAGPLISAAGTMVTLASADVGASGVRVTLSFDGLAQPPVTLTVPGCVVATPASATPTVDLSPPPPAPPPGAPAEGPSPAPAPTPVDPAGQQVTGLADLIAPGPSDAVPSAEPTSAEAPSGAVEPLSAEAPSAEARGGAVGGPAVPLLEPSSAGTTAAAPAPDVLLAQLSAAGPVVVDASLTMGLLSSATLSAGSSPVAGALPQVAPGATAPPDSGAGAPTLKASALPITAASRLLHLGGPTTGADLTTTAVLLAGALAVVVGQAARRPRWAHAPRGVGIRAVIVRASSER